MPTIRCQLHQPLIVSTVVLTVSEGIDGNQHMANVCLRSNSALPARLHIEPCARPTYVNFRILEAFL